jgi:hypothetical protein
MVPPPHHRQRRAHTLEHVHSSRACQRVSGAIPAALTQPPTRQQPFTSPFATHANTAELRRHAWQPCQRSTATHTRRWGGDSAPMKRCRGPTGAAPGLAMCVCTLHVCKDCGQAQSKWQQTKPCAQLRFATILRASHVLQLNDSTAFSMCGGGSNSQQTPPSWLVMVTQQPLMTHALVSRCNRRRSGREHRGSSETGVLVKHTTTVTHQPPTHPCSAQMETLPPTPQHNPWQQTHLLHTPTHRNSTRGGHPGATSPCTCAPPPAPDQGTPSNTHRFL